MTLQVRWLFQSDLEFLSYRYHLYLKSILKKYKFLFCIDFVFHKQMNIVTILKGRYAFKTSSMTNSEINFEKIDWFTRKYMNKLFSWQFWKVYCKWLLCMLDLLSEIADTILRALARPCDKPGASGVSDHLSKSFLRTCPSIAEGVFNPSETLRNVPCLAFPFYFLNIIHKPVGLFSLWVLYCVSSMLRVDILAVCLDM